MTNPLLFALGLSTAALLLSAGAAALFRSPAFRHHVWFLGFVVTGLCLGLGFLRWHIAVPILPAPKVVPQAARTVVMEPMARPFDQEPSNSADIVHAPSERLVPEATPAAGNPWDVVLLVWAIGAGAALLPVLLGDWHWRRLRRRCVAPNNGGLLNFYDRVSSGLRRRPRLLISPDIRTPLLAGLLRPCLLLPSDAEGWTESEWEGALQHELAHHRRRDLWTLLVSRILTGLLWFQPLAWYGLRQLRLAAEMAADDEVVSAQHAPATYAETLLTLSQRWKDHPLLPGLGIARASNLEHRLTRILDEEVERMPLLTLPRVAIGGAVLGVAVLASVLRPVTANDAPALLQEIARANQTVWEKLDSFSYTTSDLRGGDEASRFQMQWWEMGGQCRYRYWEFSDIGGVAFGMNYSFDGTESRMMQFGDKANAAILSKRMGPREFDDWIIYRTFLTSPLEFLMLAEGVSFQTTPPLALVKDRGNWERFLKDAEVLGRETFEGRECVAVKVEDRYVRFENAGLGYYVVYFDPAQDYRPAGWKAYKADGTLFAELMVTREEAVRMAAGGSVVLPREIKTLYYPAGSKWVTEFSNIAVNTLGSFKFALDETLAKHIQDWETGQFTNAPKQPFLAIRLSELEITNRPLNEVLKLIQQKAVESDPVLGKFGTSSAWPSDIVVPTFSLKMANVTVEEALAELRKQNKNLKVGIRPNSLFIQVTGGPKANPAEQQAIAYIVLPEVSFTDLPLDKALQLIREKIPYGDATLGPYGVASSWGGYGPPPTVSLHMRNATVGQMITELQRQNKNLTVLARPTTLSVSVMPAPTNAASTKETSDGSFLSIRLSDIACTDEPLFSVLNTIRLRAAESNPALGQFIVQCISQIDGPEPTFSLQMKHPTVGEVLAELQRQNKSITIETEPDVLLVKVAKPGN